ncbi:MAG: SprT family zinc-dependent metalloprotease [Chloroflexota bacterium]
MTHKTYTRPAIISEGKMILGDRVVAYRVKRSARARHLRLEMRPESGLTVIIPRSGSLRHVSDILKAKQGWILTNLAKYDRTPKPVVREIKAGDAVPYLGQKLMVLMEASCGKASCVRLEQGKLIASTASVPVKLNMLLEQWYRAQAGRLIMQKVEEWSSRLDIKHNGITVRGQKTRWGSCSRQGKLSFNWRLLMAPEPVIDYVVVHELTHLKEMNHSKRFWQAVAKHCPEWRELKKWLRAHEAELAAELCLPQA